MESILEYIEVPLNKGLRDISSYVRKTAVLGILKVQKLNPAIVKANGYLPQLYTMLQDADAMVVTNCIYAINELSLSEGGVVVTQALLTSLLSRIGEFSEWGLNALLELVSRYHPSSEDELFAIMNLLDPVLRTANSGAVLAVVKCFITLTSDHPDMHHQIYSRARPPVLTLINGASAEGQFCMLKHLEVLLHQSAARGVFDEEFRQFFVRHHEPPHVKHLKAGLLPLVASETSARDICCELGEYVTDVDSELAKCAIRSMGKIVVRIKGVSLEVTQRLVDLLDVESGYVRSQAAEVLADVVGSIVDLCGGYMCVGM